jgi:hypothetical protein
MRSLAQQVRCFAFFFLLYMIKYFLDPEVTLLPLPGELKNVI